MCEPEPAPVGAVSPADYEKMPSVIDSEDPLLNVGKKELQHALRQAYANDWVADWLFAQSANIFHRRTAALPPEAFDNSLAIHLRHDISTPAQCPQRKRSVFENGAESEKGQSDPNAFTVTKDIDLLLVPVLNVGGVTAGYSFLKGVQESAMRPSPENPNFATPSQGNGQFIAGRFSFDNARRDFLMVVNSMSPHMTGIVSMRWLKQNARERSFFAIPKAEYGPGNLPQRVLSVQCHVDYEITSENNTNTDFNHDLATASASNATFEFDRSSPAVDTASYQGTSAAPPSRFCDEACQNECSAEHLGDDDEIERDFISQGDADLDEGPPPAALNVDANNPSDDPDAWFSLEEGLGAESWGASLESIGTVISPGDYSNGILPEVLQDFAVNQQYMDEMEKILGETSDILSSTKSDPLLSNQSEQRGSKRRKDLDGLSLSPVPTTRSHSPEMDLSLDLAPSSNSSHSSWIFSSDGTTPDGVGVPRRPGGNSTSSGVFEMGKLLESLATIESSLKGNFYGPKVRKDILHPQTGELISRCTGVVTSKLDSVDPLNLSMLRSIAAQSYYASLLAVSNDTRLIAPAPNAGPFYVSGGQPSKKSRSTAEEPKRKQTKVEPKKRPPAALAPRPIATVVLPPGLPHPEVLQLSKPPVDEKKTGPMDEEAAREAKLEAKRIKNRLSAARSNQKRRAQLEAQKKELAGLRQRVDELKSRQKVVSEENESLKQQVLSRS